MTAFLHLGSSWAQNKDAAYCISKQHLQQHVAFLCSDALEGRLTGTPGEKYATQYVADIFKHLGLEPAGDNGTFFQVFNFTSGVSLGKNNFLTFSYSNGKTKQLLLNQDWRPLGFSDNTSFHCCDFVFAGYGISAPTYDSYHALDVKNKWVIVFRYIPEKISMEQRRELIPYSSLRYKAFVARKKGAKGIIFINDPHSKVKDELIPLSFQTSSASAGIIAISLCNNIAKEIIDNPIRPFKLSGQIELLQKKQQGRNVLAKLKINSSTATSLLMVGAHIDHLGHGEFSHCHSQQIHHGADDNASGVASVIETATKLSELKTQGKLQGNRDILFSIWSGEEIGLLGSMHFIKDFLKNKHSTVDAYINLDMVGRLRKNLIVQGVGSSANWLKCIDKTRQHYHIPLIMQNDSYLPTDSTAFYLHQIPALNLFTGSHKEYHTPQDTVDTLNFEGMQSISQFLVDLIVTLEHHPIDIGFQKGETQPAFSRGYLRIYFGTIPDYASSDCVGVKLAGVKKGSPSERAGVKQNDLIIELAGKAIRDIYDYTFVMSALQANEPVPLVVMRNQKRMTLSIIPLFRE